MASHADGPPGDPGNADNKVSLPLPRNPQHASTADQVSPAAGSSLDREAAQSNRAKSMGLWLDPSADHDGTALSRSTGKQASKAIDSDTPGTAAAKAVAGIPTPAGLHGPSRKPQGVSLAILKQLAVHVEQVAAQHALQGRSEQPPGEQHAAGQVGNPAPAGVMQDMAPPPQPQQQSVDNASHTSLSSGSNSLQLQLPALADFSDAAALRTAASAPPDMLPPSPFAVLHTHRHPPGALRKKKPGPLALQRSMPEAAQDEHVSTPHPADLRASFDSYVAGYDTPGTWMPTWLQPDTLQKHAASESSISSNNSRSGHAPAEVKAGTPAGVGLLQANEKSSDDMPDDFLQDRPIIAPRYPTSQQKASSSPTAEAAPDKTIAASSEAAQVSSPQAMADSSGFLLNPFAARQSSSSHSRYGNSSGGSKEHVGPPAASDADSRGLGNDNEADQQQFELSGNHLGTGFGGLLLSLHSGMHDEYGEGEDDDDEANQQGHEEDYEEAQEVEDEEGVGEEPAADSYQMIQELSQLKEELSAQRSVAAGLRGELRKYTQLAAALEAQMQGLKQSQLSSSSTSTLPPSVNQLLSVSSTAVNMHAQQAAAAKAAAGAAARDSNHSSGSSGADEDDKGEADAAKSSGAGADAVKQAVLEGLEANKRLALYQEALSGNISMATGSIKEELLAAEEVLKGKAHLDSGSEKVVLIKLQKIIQAGASAARTLEHMQSDRKWGLGHTGLYGTLSTSVLPQSMFASSTVKSDGSSLLPASSSAPLQGQTSVAVGPDSPSPAAAGEPQQSKDAAGTQTDSPEAKASAGPTPRERQLAAEVAQLMEENAALQRELAILRAQLSPPVMVSPFAVPQASSAAAAACGQSISNASQDSSSPTGQGSSSSKPPRPSRLSLVSSQRGGSRRSASAPNSPSRSSPPAMAGKAPVPPQPSGEQPIDSPTLQQPVPPQPSQVPSPTASLPKGEQQEAVAQPPVLPQQPTQDSCVVAQETVLTVSQPSGPSTPSGEVKLARMSDQLSSAAVELSSTVAIRATPVAPSDGGSSQRTSSSVVVNSSQCASSSIVMGSSTNTPADPSQPYGNSGSSPAGVGATAPGTAQHPATAVPVVAGTVNSGSTDFKVKQDSSRRANDVPQKEIPVHVPSTALDAKDGSALTGSAGVVPAHKPAGQPQAAARAPALGEQQAAADPLTPAAAVASQTNSNAPLRLLLLHQLLTAPDDKIEVWQQALTEPHGKDASSTSGARTASESVPAADIQPEQLQKRVAELVQAIDTVASQSVYAQHSLPAAGIMSESQKTTPPVQAQQQVGPPQSQAPGAPTPGAGVSNVAASAATAPGEPASGGLLPASRSQVVPTTPPSSQVQGTKPPSSPPVTPNRGQLSIAGDSAALQAELTAKTAEAADLRYKVVQLAMRLDELTAKQQAGASQQHSTRDVATGALPGTQAAFRPPAHIRTDRSSPVTSGSNSPMAAAAAAAAANSLIHLSAALTQSTATGSPSRLAAGPPAAGSSSHAAPTNTTSLEASAGSQHAVAQRATSEPALVPGSDHAASMPYCSLSNASQQEDAVATALESVSYAAVAASKLLLGMPATTAGPGMPAGPTAMQQQQAAGIVPSSNAISAAAQHTATADNSQRLPLSFAELYNKHMQQRFGS